MFVIIFKCLAFLVTNFYLIIHYFFSIRYFLNNFKHLLPDLTLNQNLYALYLFLL